MSQLTTNPSERKHALLSASAADRWLNCPPSARLSETYEDSGSAYAAEGTDAHTLAEFKIRQVMGEKVQHPQNSLQHYNTEMEGHTTDFAVFVCGELLEKAHQACDDPLLLLEQRVDYSKYAPEGFGTCDVILVADQVLHIVDFKYGMGVLVEADHNPQLMLYGLAALEMFAGIYDIDTVVMTIFQPRRDNISTFEMSATDLRHWAEETLRPAATLAYAGEGEFKCGDHCKFCKAKAQCRTRAEHNLKLAQLEFKMPALLEDEEISIILAQADELATWAKDIQDYAFKSALGGKQWDGFKLVAGRSNRKFTNEDAVAKAATDAGYKDIYRQSLITLTDMERLMGKADFQEILGYLVTKPPGKPTLVPDSDKRKAIQIPTAAEEFAIQN